MSEPRQGRENRRPAAASASAPRPAKRSRAARASPSHVGTASAMFTQQPADPAAAAPGAHPSHKPPHLPRSGAAVEAVPACAPPADGAARRGGGSSAGGGGGGDVHAGDSRREDDPSRDAGGRRAGGVAGGLAPRQPAKKKMTFLPFDRAPAKKVNNLCASEWAQVLEPAVVAVFGSDKVSHSLELLYRKVEDICMHKQASELYTKLRSLCDKHAAEEVLKLAGLTVDSDAFLRLVDDTWKRRSSQMLSIRSIFLHLDRTHVVQGGEANTRSLWDMNIQQFRLHFGGADGVENKTINALLALINRARDGETVDHARLRSLLRMFSALGTYEESFQIPFILATGEYYKAESMNLCSEMDVPVYLRHAEMRLKQEAERSSQVLDSATREPLIALTEQKLLKDHVSYLLKKGFQTMCDEKRKDDLGRCFTLLGRINRHYKSSEQNAHALMKTHLTNYVKRVGSAIVSDKSKDGEMVSKLLALKAQLDDSVSVSFGGSDMFVLATNSAFESFVNARENKPAELIAKYLDGVLRTGNKGYSEEELENTLDRVLTLFRFIDGKDVFEAFYKKDLSKRLLYSKSASHDLEKVMISKLKAECGSQFTSKLESMFKDIEISTDLMRHFKQQGRVVEQGAGSSKVDLVVYVLATANWPLTIQLPEVKLPQELLAYQEHYKHVYSGKHPRRKLTWQHSDGSCSVTARFPKGTKILSLSLYQTVIVMLFNESEQMSYNSIYAASGIEARELKRTLLSLACGKVRVMQKVPKGPTIEETDEFKFNESLTHKQTRIKVNAIQMKETVEENAVTTEKVFQERSYQIDASVVRIMKTRKTLSHLELVTEVTGQLKFPHKSTDIKKRISSLIDREYIERDPDDNSHYKYIA